MKFPVIIAEFFTALAIVAAEAPMPSWLKCYPGLTAPVVRKPYIDTPDPAFQAALKKNPNADKWIRAAEKNIGKPFPEISDDLYMDFFRTGNRKRFEKINQPFVARIIAQTQAYALTGDVRFVRESERIIRKYCELRSWVLPAHDRNHVTFDGKDFINDLASTEMALRMGLALAVMKRDMDPAVYALGKREILRRVIEPMEEAFRSEKVRYWWLKANNNWNSVCNAHLIQAAVCILWDEPERLTKFVDCCLRDINYSLKPFRNDGYCAEGCGYWNYGVGRYLHAALAVYVMTNGKQNLMDNPKVRCTMLYPYKIVMTETLVPAFADSGYNSVPLPRYLQISDFLQGKRIKADLISIQHDLSRNMMDFLAENPAAKGKPAKVELERVSTFPESVAAVCRPGKTGSRLATAWMGGNNYENHNHNDMGSFIVAVDDIPVLCDPVHGPYNAKTFGRDRYKDPLLGSFGHDVPLIDGNEQICGKDTDAKLLHETRKENFFAWEVDIARSYKVPGLKSLVRTFAYDWTGTGKITVTDDMKADRPVSFETALVTPGKFKEIAPDTLEVTFKEKTLVVKISTGKIPYEFHETVLKGGKTMGEKPTRLGIRLKKKVRNAKISFDITVKQ